MARRHTPQEQFRQAKQIAADHGMFVIERGGAYQVYRQHPDKNIFLGKRSSAEGLRQLVAKLANFH